MNDLRGLIFVKSVQADATAYRTNPSRIKHRAALIADLETTFIAGTRRHWIDTLLAAGIPAGPINDFAEAL